MRELTQLPNVGPKLAHELEAAGIATDTELRALGATAAWERLREINPDRDCANSLLALEGAVRGVRWMSIDPDERRQISAYADARRRTPDGPPLTNLPSR
jgi:DNA transformation protein